MSPVRKSSYFSLSIIFISTCLSDVSFAESTTKDEATANQLERVVVTAHRQKQTLKEVSASVSVLNEQALEQSVVVDISDLENVVAGLRIGTSGAEVRPAMRGARTNEVGVSGSGIAEQIVGIFQDGIYLPTTTVGLGAYIDVERIEVLRGPQGTLYGRNTFAGSINISTKQPVMDETEGSFKLLAGSFNRRNYEAVVNLPISEHIATRLVTSIDEHDGYITNHHIPGPEDDLREKNQSYVRWVTRYQADDDFSALLRIDYSHQNANSDAIWGYQQIFGFQLLEVEPGTGVFNPNPVISSGHIYAPDDQLHQDIGPYDVYRNAESLSKQKSLSGTLQFQWYLPNMDFKWTTNLWQFDAKQFYDNDYSDGGLNRIGGFGRVDAQRSWSSEWQVSSTDASTLSWLAGVYLFSQKADWSWLWRIDSNDDGTADAIGVPSWGNPEYDPHKVKSLAAFGQFKFEISDTLRAIAGVRYNKDDKAFSGQSIPKWQDSAWLWKLGLEYDWTSDIMLYANASTGYRTGGANDPRVVARGADALYGNEAVFAVEGGMKAYLIDNSVQLNVSVFANRYSDVKAQLFAVACNDTSADMTVVQCVSQGTSTTFEYYQNGGDVDAYGAEVQLRWMPVSKLNLAAGLAWLQSTFADNYRVGNDKIRPLLGLGNIGNRQNINDDDSTFSFANWRPGMSPQYTLRLAGHYDISLADGAYLSPHIQLSYVDDYYGFDTNIAQTRVAEHLMADARLLWHISSTLEVALFVKNITDKTVMTRAVVHSQIVNGLPANSVQANWSDPRTWGLSVKFQF